MPAIRDLSFDEWINHAFGHDLPLHGNAWFWDNNQDFWDPEPRQGIDYLTRLFGDASSHLAKFSDAQVAQGLTYLVNDAIGAQPYAHHRSVPADQRARLWGAVTSFFRDYLMPRCTPALGHLSEPGTALNSSAYMWWEGFPATFSFDEPGYKTVMMAEIGALAAIVRLDSAACQEAALHGLGHMIYYEPARAPCQEIIDAYLAAGLPARPELIVYAKAARGGCIQ